jgi:hypothetical protein
MVAVFPQRCVMCIAGMQDDDFTEHKLGYWNNVYGTASRTLPVYMRRLSLHALLPFSCIPGSLD